MKNLLYFNSVLLSPFKVFLSVLLFSLLMLSCGKDKEIIDLNSKDKLPFELNSLKYNVGEEDGILVFKSLVEFKAVYNELSQQFNLKDISIKGDNFESFSDAFYAFTPEYFEESGQELTDFAHLIEILEIGGEKYIEPVISSPIAGLLFNHEGLLIIDNKLYHHKNDIIIIYDKSNSSLSHSELNPKIAIDSIEVTNSIISHHEIPIESEIGSRADLCQCDDNYTSNYKLSGELSKSCVVSLYADLRVDTKHRRKRFGAWWYNSADELSQVGFVEYCSLAGNGSILTHNTNRQCSDCSSIRTLVSEGEGCPCLVDSDVTHSGEANGHNDLSCTLLCDSDDDNDTCYFNCE